MVLNAAELKVGQKAKILKIQESRFTRRLFEMGCVPGTSITLEFKSPAGDPIAFDINGYTLGLRISEASLIEVDTLD